MGRYYNHLTAAENIITQNKGSEPLAVQLKKYFSANKKHGSKDRRQISSLCYAYYRAAHALKEGDIKTKITRAYFLVQQTSDALLQELDPELNATAEKSLGDKMAMLGIHIEDIFPFYEMLGGDFCNEGFYQSLLLQPKLFLRTRPGRKNTVKQKLAEAAVEILMDSGDCLAIKNSTKLEDLLELNRDAVVQDFSSQQVLDFLKGYIFEQAPSAWDACAASGGKSILVHDILDGRVKITVSDIRPTMLHNLGERLKQAGVNIYRKFSADLTKPVMELTDEKFDIILCDVPCTGSGTWARTPEQLYYFDAATIDVFAIRQQQIVKHCLPFLKPGGLFFYITCSVFKKENEEVGEWIGKQVGLKLLNQKYIAGYGEAADNMFVGLWRFE